MKISLLLITVIFCISACNNDSADIKEDSSAAEVKHSVADIYSATWIAEKIDGNQIDEKHSANIRFDKDGHVSGTTGCNRFAGMAEIAGDKLKFGQLATTRRACVPGLMEQEGKILKAIEDTEKYSIDKDLLLTLKDSENKDLMVLSGIAVTE